MKIFNRETCFSSLLSCYGLMLLLGLTFSSATTAQSNNTAQLIIEGVSNSSSIGSKSFIVTKYADEACSKHGKTHKVYKKKFAKNVHTFKPVTVDTSRPFIFQVSYLEERRSEVKRCAAIANVDLKENGNYKAIFSIVDEVLGCNIKIYDLDPVAVAELNEATTPPLEIESNGEIVQMEAEVDEPSVAQKDAENVSLVASSPLEIEYKKPAETCTKVGKMGYKNGTPVYTYKDRFG